MKESFGIGIKVSKKKFSSRLFIVVFWRRWWWWVGRTVERRKVAAIKR
jgi:hypothetical protein